MSNSTLNRLDFLEVTDDEKAKGIIILQVSKKSLFFIASLWLFGFLFSKEPELI